MLPRYAFQLQIRPDKIDAYDAAHRDVWPELLAKLKAVGISDYSIFRRGTTLILVLNVDDFDGAWAVLDKDPVNQRWQEAMAEIFEPLNADMLEPGERFPMLREVFYLP